MTEKCSMIKIVVFDLDETLGYFSEFGMVWDAVTMYVNESQTLFNELLDLFPEFLRPNILQILNYLKHKKIKSKCNKLILYTNNQGPSEWAKSIIQYFESKLEYKLFDQIIGAYRIGGRQIEMERTTHSKTHGDLTKCAKLPANAHICFLDDLYHPEMKNDNVYYINIKAYKHDLNYSEMATRVINYLKNVQTNNVFDENEFKEQFTRTLNRYHYAPIDKLPAEQQIDEIVSKQMLYYLKDFFKDGKNKQRNKNITQKNKYFFSNKSKNKTAKHTTK